MDKQRVCKGDVCGFEPTSNAKSASQTKLKTQKTERAASESRKKSNGRKAGGAKSSKQKKITSSKTKKQK